MDAINTGVKLSDEQIAKIKEAALKRAKEIKGDELGDKATEEETKEAQPINRNVFLDKKVTIEIFDGDKVTKTISADRNILEICLVLRDLDPETVISIYGKEGPGSDPLPEGQEEPKYPIFNITKITVKEAMATLISNMVPEDICLNEYQRLGDFMSFRSTLKVCMLTAIFKGGQPGGFSYLSSCTDVSPDDLVKLYAVAKTQLAQYKDKVKELYPGTAFPDDSNIITHL